MKIKSALQKDMKRSIPVVLVLLCAICIQSTNSSERTVKVLDLKTAITPVSAEYLMKAIKQAEDEKSECLVIQLDTPGGLMTSMEDIVKAILGSQVPIVVYVAPSGATAGSAGVFITIAAHIAAMAPATNIGAAHPVTIGTPVDTSKITEEKQTNNAAAYVRALAEKRKKNADWVEKAVRQSVSITAVEALKLGVIDLIAPSLDSLLTLINGRTVEVALGKKTLATKDAHIDRIKLGLRYEILDLIVNPNIAYILMMIGMAGVMLELYNPGSIFPGVIGGICLILAFYAMQTLPVNYAGLLLILLSVVLFILEIKIASYGLLTIGGIISLTIGSIMLFDTSASFMRVSWAVIIPSVVLLTLLFLFAVGLIIKARSQQPTTGSEGLIGEIGIAKTDIAPEGTALIHGELWNAVSEESIKAGEKVQVVATKQLRITVKKCNTM